MGEYLISLNKKIQTNIICGLTDMDFEKYKIVNLKPIGKVQNERNVKLGPEEAPVMWNSSESDNLNM